MNDKNKTKEQLINELVELRQKITALERSETERKLLEEEHKKLVITDKLTKAYNRPKFEEIIAIEIERAKRFDHPLSMLMFDIDGFKKVNDTFGHLIGDYVLKTIADIIRANTRKINHLIRWGGDEFVIIPVETGLEGARVLSERLRNAIESFDFYKAGKITVSFGIAQFEKDDTEDAFLKRADDALYKSKASGGNRVEACA
jgi:diguanylate cyclase (GGDEF)-like protein